MMKLLVLAVVFFCGARSELVVSVNPPIVQPGITASFSINCALLEAEEMIVASLSLSRQTISRNIGQINPVERIATLRSSRPNAPAPARGYERATIFGQITSLESELGTYLKMIWASPSIEDLGTYICEATVVGQMGELVTLTAETSVTTADLATDRLLVAMRSLEGNINSFNQSLLSVQAQLDVLTFRVEALESGRVATENETTALWEEVYTGGPVKTTVAPAGYGGSAAESALARLADAIEKIDAKFDTFNRSLASFERQLLQIEMEVEEEAAADNTTTPAPVLYDVIQTYFAFENSSYFLFRGSENTDTYRAQGVCEGKRLYLAEIVSEAQFQAILSEISDVVRDDSAVLISGLKREGQRVWRYQASGEPVSFVQWGPGEPVETRNHECLALRRSIQGFAMATVSCSGDQENIYFLCEGAF